MAFDGIVVAGMVADLREKLMGGRIVKIIQPERDELIITVKNYDQYLLFTSADASLPLVYLTDSKKEAPLNSPAFCMLLRKYLTGARIVGIEQPDFERIINIKLEHFDEMGDKAEKTLIIEIMGKHSNIILCDADGRILDSIKHVPASVSSVREVLPGRDYFITRTTDKLDPLNTDEGTFISRISSSNDNIVKSIYMAYTGISPLAASEIVYRSGIDPDMPANTVPAEHLIHLYNIFDSLFGEIRDGNFHPNIVLKDGRAFEFSLIKLTSLLSDPSCTEEPGSDVSSVLVSFYAKKNAQTRIRQRSAELRHIVATAIERESKKYELQLKQLADTEKREKYKLYGELLSAYGYGIDGGLKETVVNNYYTGEDITIPLDPEKSGIENSKSYYDRYAKLKRTYEALSRFTAETHDVLEQLGSLQVALDIAVIEDDLTAVRDELSEYGFIKKQHYVKGKSAKRGSGRQTSMPFHYLTSDGFHIYVGKNNYQNDELTFKFARGDDWWFHAKGVPGSHVIVRTEGRELPDRVYEQAAALAAFYSKNRDSEKTEVDYLERKNVKKPAGARPGFVVYYTNYSMVVKPEADVTGLESI